MQIEYSVNKTFPFKFLIYNSHFLMLTHWHISHYSVVNLMSHNQIKFTASPTHVFVRFAEANFYR